MRFSQICGHGLEDSHVGRRGHVSSTSSYFLFFPRVSSLTEWGATLDGEDFLCAHEYR